MINKIVVGVRDQESTMNGILYELQDLLLEEKTKNKEEHKRKRKKNRKKKN